MSAVSKPAQSSNVLLCVNRLYLSQFDSDAPEEIHQNAAWISLGRKNLAVGIVAANVERAPLAKRASCLTILLFRLLPA
jgi:hypothetical protein